MHLLASRIGLVGFLIAMNTASGALAEERKQKTSSVTAVLYEVREGLFDAEQNQVMDLTDRQIVFKWFPWNDAESNLKSKYIGVQLNNKKIALNPGARINLRDVYELREDLADKSRCILDFIDVAVPKGGAAIATFRLDCR